MQDFSVTLTPRFYETDAMGHINNATIAAWFEVARVEFIRSIAGDRDAHSKAWILASVQLDYLAETFVGSDVDIRIVDARIGNTSLTVHCEMWQSGRQTVKGKAVVVHIDYDSKTTVPIPDTMRERLRQV